VINFFQETGEVPSDLKKALENAVTCALISLQTEAALRQCDITELSCTLLVLLWTQNQDGPGGTALTFQAGDGLIVSIDEDARFIPLAAQDAEAFAGETHFLASRHVHLTWDERFKSFPTDITPLGFLVMTDGVADDLIPYEKNGSILVKELREILDAENWGEALVDLLGYEKRGSFDDRTLVCAFLHPPASDCGLMEASTPGHASLMEIEVEKPQAVQIGVDGESRAGGRNKG
jgi:hypothetical protein